MCTDITVFFIKHLRCIQSSSFFYSMYMRQYFIVYFDQFFCFFYCFPVLCRYQSNCISQIMYQTTNRYQRILIMF